MPRRSQRRLRTCRPRRGQSDPVCSVRPHPVPFQAGVVEVLWAALPSGTRVAVLDRLREMGLGDAADLLAKREVSSRRGRYPRRVKGAPWLASAYLLLTRAHRDADGEPTAIVRSLKAWQAATNRARSYAAGLGLEARLIPFDRLVDCDHVQHAATASGVSSTYALAVLAEATGQAEEGEAVRGQVERGRQRALNQLNAERSSLGLPAIPRPARGTKTRGSPALDYLTTALAHLQQIDPAPTEIVRRLKQVIHRHSQ